MFLNRKLFLNECVRWNFSSCLGARVNELDIYVRFVFELHKTKKLMPSVSYSELYIITSKYFNSLSVSQKKNPPGICFYNFFKTHLVFSYLYISKYFLQMLRWNQGTHLCLWFQGIPHANAFGSTNNFLQELFLNTFFNEHSCSVRTNLEAKGNEFLRLDTY